MSVVGCKIDRNELPRMKRMVRTIVTITKDLFIAVTMDGDWESFRAPGRNLRNLISGIIFRKKFFDQSRSADSKKNGESTSAFDICEYDRFALIWA